MPNKILFISHEATLTGAPLLLLTFLKWLKQHTDIQFCVLLRRDGTLRNDFEAVSKTYVFSHPYSKNQLSFSEKIKNHFFTTPYLIPRYYKQLRRELQQEKFNLIYSNTITNGSLLEFLSYLNCKVITHIHEMSFVIDFFGKKNIELVKRYTNQYIAASKAVKNDFCSHQSISPEQIEIADNFINPLFVENSVNHQNYSVRQELNLQLETFVIGCAGSIEWRKGADLLIPLALSIKQQKPDLNICFLWVGSKLNDLYFTQIQFDIQKAKLQDSIRFLGQKEIPLTVFSAFDVFLLPSREEPFGIVGIECAYLEIPVICFEKSGGMAEFVETDAGFVVPYLDIDAMAEKVIALHENKDLRMKLGKRAKTKVAERHSIDIQAKKIVEIIEKV